MKRIAALGQSTATAVEANETAAGAMRRIVLLFAAMVVKLIFTSGVALAVQMVSCSILGSPCNDTSGDDFAQGTNNAETIKVFGGADTVYGNGGNDLVYGGSGSDTLYGHGGNDTLYGDRGNDAIDAITFDTSGSTDYTYGGRGNDTIYANDDNTDYGYCGSGSADTVYYDADKDTLKDCEVKQAI
jgi:Ca2+-binding RTX toxin-like protein